MSNQENILKTLERIVYDMEEKLDKLVTIIEAKNDEITALKAKLEDENKE